MEEDKQPPKPSDLFELALDHLESVHAGDFDGPAIEFHVDMNEFGLILDYEDYCEIEDIEIDEERTGTDVCLACLAGCAFVGEDPRNAALGFDTREINATFAEYGDSPATALDDFRRGKIWSALGHLSKNHGLPFGDTPFQKVTDWEDDPEQAVADMREIVEKLKRSGL